MRGSGRLFHPLRGEVNALGKGGKHALFCTIISFEKIQASRIRRAMAAAQSASDGLHSSRFVGSGARRYTLIKLLTYSVK